MLPTRIFLGTGGPLLPLAAGWAADQPDHSESLWLVVPGSRAQRRLDECLADVLDAAESPPQVVVLGSLPERLYRPDRKVASGLESRLAVSRALQSLGPDDSRTLWGRDGDVAPLDWWRLSADVERLDDELAAANRIMSEYAAEDPRGDVLARALADRDLCLASLRLVGRNEARRSARPGFAPHEPRPHIVLVGCLEVSPMLAGLLDRAEAPVTVLVFADAADADFFDDWGRPIADRWLDRSSPSEADEEIVVADPLEAASAVLDFLEKSAAGERPDAVTVACGDSTSMGLLGDCFRLAGIPCRTAPIRRVTDTSPAVLLRLAAEFARSPLWEAFAALVRRSDLVRWLQFEAPELSPNWLAELNESRRQGLWESTQDLPSGDIAAALLGRVRAWVSPLLCEADTPAGWAGRISQLLRPVYGCVSAEDPERPQLLECLPPLRDAMRQLVELPADLAEPVALSQALLMIEEALGSAVLPDEFGEPSMEVVGWLEALHDDAPILAVVGLNDGWIPETRPADGFLHDSLRRKLGLPCDLTRFARDAAVLSAKQASTRARRLISFRRDGEGNPSRPSRLLLTGDIETIRWRVGRFCGEDPPALRPIVPSGERNEVGIPKPPPALHPDRLGVTDFSAYLRCPYRYYLSRIAKLEELTDDSIELDHRGFGDLLHKVLEAFGQAPIRDSESQVEIEEFLISQLHDDTHARFGTRPSLPVRLQLRLMERRLRAFAGAQSEQRREGWRFLSVERSLRGELETEDGRRVLVTGRIDRLEAREGELRIVDYKVRTKARSPEQQHRTGPVSAKVWVDFQLPLYHWLCRSIEPGRDRRLAFFTLSAADEETRVETASWSDAELDEALDQARKIAGRILDGVFWPPNPAAGGEFDLITLARCPRGAE